MKSTRQLLGPDLEAQAPDEVLENLRAAPYLRSARHFLSAHPEVAAFEQIGAESHYRYECADGQLSGHGEICGITEGFMLQVSDAETRWPRVVAVSSPDVMRISISLEGSEWLSQPGERGLMTDGPGALVTLEPAGQPPTRLVFRGRQAMVLIYLDREALQGLWREREHELPGLLQTFLAGTLQETATRRMALKSDLLRCLEDLRRCDQEGLARTMFMRAKGFEIFCHILKMLEVDEGFGGSDASLVTSKGILRAQQILKRRFVSPPSLDELARETGISRSSLCAGFRQIVGKSVGGYVQELRMEKALQLLNESPAPITEIAFALGYNHPSSFTLAVQRHFGMSPRELRRSGRPA